MTAQEWGVLLSACCLLGCGGEGGSPPQHVPQGALRVVSQGRISWVHCTLLAEARPARNERTSRFHCAVFEEQPSGPVLEGGFFSAFDLRPVRQPQPAFMPMRLRVAPTPTEVVGAVIRLSYPEVLAPEGWVERRSSEGQVSRRLYRDGLAVGEETVD